VRRAGLGGYLQRSRRRSAESAADEGAARVRVDVVDAATAAAALALVAE
jgi:hypothetical protein